MRGGNAHAAIALALSEPKGPVHLDLPEDVALAALSELVPANRSPARMHATPHFRDNRIVPEATLDARGKLLATRNDRRGHRREGDAASAAPRCCAVVEHHGFRSPPRPWRKASSTNHPLAIGCIERAWRQLQRGFIREHADLIIGLGYDTVEVEYEAWIGDVPLLHVDVERADVDSSVRIVHEVVGPLANRSPRSPGWIRSRTHGRGRLAMMVFTSRRWTHTARLSAVFAAGGRPLLTARGDRRCAPRSAARGGARLRRRRPHAPDRKPVDGLRSAHVPHYKRLVFHGLRVACCHRGQTRAAGSPGRVHRRRRLFPDDVRRVRGGQT